MSTYDFKLPDIGEGLHEAEIVKWLVKEGDTVKENDSIVEVQTDKAVVEISAPVSGEIEKLGGEEGTAIKVGEILVRFSRISDERAQGAIAEEVEFPTPPEEVQVSKASKENPVKKNPNDRILAAPSIRKAARDAGVDLREVNPTGKGGKILAKDLQRHLDNGQEQEKREQSEEQEISPLAANQHIVFPSTEDRIEKITGTRKMIFEKMTKAQRNAVMCTGMDEVNVSSLVQMRRTLMPNAEQQQIKLTYLPFIIKAVTHTLKRYPIFNSSVNEENMTIQYHQDIHIGVATATENGLVVPVIKHADKKSILEIAKEIEELTQKARNKKLKAAELTGSTFTISNTGSQGGWYATPIINYPEVAIMGIHKIKKQAIVVDDEIQIGHMMGMSLTFDHRIIDGEPSGRFMHHVKEILEKPELLILEAK